MYLKINISKCLHVLSQKNWRCGDDRVIISVLVYFQVHRRRVPESRAKKHTCHLPFILICWPSGLTRVLIVVVTYMYQKSDMPEINIERYILH